ncbi:thioredoxin [Crucibulum laeve]|uniref:Thioredoxin n=1 Tax=Crucibulum laeve TaxID=68775 RepID=A0A5C3M9T8_9AGAR|nr:thioredoxin [Crucibulum laeve]
MGVTPITSLEQFRTIINGEKPVIIDFWATWCGPCRIISPIFEKLSGEKDIVDVVDFYKVDVDEQSDISQEVGVRAMPTFIAFKAGNKAGEVVGARPQELQSLVKELTV